MSKIKAKVTRKSHSRSESGRMVTYQEGDEIQVSERELSAFGDRLEKVESKGGRHKGRGKQQQQLESETEVSEDGEAGGE